MSNLSWHLALADPSFTPLVEARSTDQPDYDKRVVLANTFTHDWEFEDGHIPGHLEPTQMSFELAAYTLADIEPFSRGRRFIIFLTLMDVPAGFSYLPITEYARVTDIQIELDPHRRRPVTAKITAAGGLAGPANQDLDLWAAGAIWLYDLLNDNTQPGSGWGAFNYDSWPGQALAISLLSGFPVAYPDAVPIDFMRGSLVTLGGQGSTHDLLKWLANTAPISGRHVSPRIHYSQAPHVVAGGLKYAIDPSGSIWEDWLRARVPAPVATNWSDPLIEMLVLQPLDRYVSGPVEPAFRLVFDPELWQWQVEGLEPDLAADSEVTWLPACVAPTPIKMSATRAHAVTAVNVEGGTVDSEPEAKFGVYYLHWRDSHGSTQVVGPDVSFTGINSRDVNTLLNRVTNIFDSRTVGEEPAVTSEAFIAANPFFTDASVNESGYAFDEVELLETDFLSTVDWIRTISRLSPLTRPVSASANLARPAVIHGIDPVLGLSHNMIEGWPIAGTLKIERGTLTYAVTMSPGRGLPLAPTGVVTFDEIEDTPSVQFNLLDPEITFGTLLYTEGPA